jgi:dihydrofolate reductase
MSISSQPVLGSSVVGRPVVLQVSALSIDGCICEARTPFAALAEPVVDDERDAWMVRSLWRAGVHIMGAQTFRDMSAWWPQSTEVFADVMNQIPKVAFSRTMTDDDITWGESRIAGGETADELAALKAEGTGEIIAHGGAVFAQYLATHGLVDEYRLIVYPVAAGSGTRLFGPLQQPVGLRLVSCTPFPSGSVALVYRPDVEAAASASTS